MKFFCHATCFIKFLTSVEHIGLKYFLFSDAYRPDEFILLPLLAEWLVIVNAMIFICKNTLKLLVQLFFFYPMLFEFEL